MRGPECTDVQGGGQLEVQGEGRQTGPGILAGATSIQFSSVQSLSCVQLFATPGTAACQASLSITNSWSLFKLMSIESVMPSSHLISFLRYPFPPLRGTLNFLPQLKKSPVFPSSTRDDSRLPCIAWKGMLTSPSHLERRLVSI